MAFDAIGFAPGAFSQPAPIVPVQAPVGDAVPVQDRLAMTVGYAALGFGAGAGVALTAGALGHEVLAALAVVPLIGAAMAARSCIRQLHWSALPLLALLVGGAAWVIACTILPDRAIDLVPAISLFAGAAVGLSVLFGRAFPTAFALAMLTMTLAAPVAAAAMMATFGR